MKNILKITLTLLLLGSVTAAEAQFRYGRPFTPYHRPQYQQNDRMARNGEPRQKNKVAYQKGDSHLLFSLNYAVSQPLGSLKDYASNISLNGWSASLLYTFSPKLAIGLGSGFYDYYQKFPRKVYNDKNTAISAVQTHTLQLIPIQPTVLYFPNGDQDKKVQPYVGLGIGITDVNYKKYWGKFVDKNNSIAFSASPMIGLKVPISKTSPVEFNADLRYNFVPYSKNEIKDIHTVEANAGLSIYLR